MWKQLFITLLVLCCITGLLLILHRAPTNTCPVFDISNLDFTQDIKVSTLQNKEFMKGGNTFKITAQNTILYDADTERISAYKTISYNYHKIIITEIYSENQLFLTVNNIPFKSKISMTEYRAGTFDTNNSYISIDISNESVEIPAPEDCDKYYPVDTPKALYDLEIACCYLMQAYTVASEYSENIYIGATGDRRTQTIYTRAVDQNNWRVTTQITQQLQNDSRIDQINEFNKTEYFCNGKYRVQTEKDQSATEFSLTDSEMRKVLQNRLVSTLILPQYIIGITAEEAVHTVRYTFKPSKEFATHLSESACQNLYQNPDLLNEIASDFSVDSLYSYVTIEKETGLPLNSGILFYGQYKISNIPYIIQYQATQTYQFDLQ